MKISGIVAEYNPIHLGHEYHIDRTRELLGADCGIVCVMSGSFVQRGENAVYSKNARAEAAIYAGADLVLELPLPWALAAAEGFARGAVGILGALGVVSHLSFGSECGEISALEDTAELLSRPELDGLIREELMEGIPYAAARQRAAERLAGRQLPVLAGPNNILALEYLRAISAQNLAMTPVTVKRAGAGHDSHADSALPSAAELRRRLRAGENVDELMPEGCAEVFRQETDCGRGPVLPEALDALMLSRLRMLPKEAFDDLPDATEGLGARLCKAVAEPTLDAVVASAKTKRYALSRLRRMLACAALGVTRGDSAGIPPYIRLLAANSRGLDILRAAKAECPLPIVTKPAEIRALDERSRHIFALETGATDLLALGFQAREERRGGRDWRISPFICTER